MPNPNLTSILVVLDRSGSMEHLRESTVGGLNQFFTDQRAQPGDVRLTMVQFDDVYEIVRNDVDLKTMPNLTQDDFVPRGMTALFDAIGKGVTDLGTTLSRLPEEERPGAVIVVIQTDGQENSSREFTLDQVNAMINKHQTDKYAWKFIFLGANQDAIATGAAMGIGAASSLSYNANPLSTAKAFQAVNQVASWTRSGGTRGQANAGTYASYVANDQATFDSSLSSTLPADPGPVVVDPKDPTQP